MNTKLILVEAKLFLRDPGSWISALGLPTGLLLILGAIPALREPSKDFGGDRFIDVFAPSLLVVTLAMLAVNLMPIRLASYREKGVLRRFATTPVHPARLLIAQIVVNFGVAIASAGLLLLVGRIVFGIPFPQHLLGFALAFTVGIAALLAFGTLVAAVAPTARAGTGLALPLFFVTMFVGGVYLPRPMLPDWIVQVGEYFPPGVQALQDTWLGAGPEWVQLGTMAVVAALVGVLATKLFRWE